MAFENPLFCAVRVLKNVQLRLLSWSPIPSYLLRLRLFFLWCLGWADFSFLLFLGTRKQLFTFLYRACQGDFIFYRALVLTNPEEVRSFLSNPQRRVHCVGPSDIHDEALSSDCVICINGRPHQSQRAAWISLLKSARTPSEHQKQYIASSLYLRCGGDEGWLPVQRAVSAQAVENILHLQLNSVQRRELEDLCGEYWSLRLLLTLPRSIHWLAFGVLARKCRMMRQRALLFFRKHNAFQCRVDAFASATSLSRQRAERALYDTIFFGAVLGVFHGTKAVALRLTQQALDGSHEFEDEDLDKVSEAEVRRSLRNDPPVTSVVQECEEMKTAHVCGMTATIPPRSLVMANISVVNDVLPEAEDDVTFHPGPRACPGFDVAMSHLVAFHNGARALLSTMGAPPPCRGIFEKISSIWRRLIMSCVYMPAVVVIQWIRISTKKRKKLGISRLIYPVILKKSAHSLKLEVCKNVSTWARVRFKATLAALTLIEMISSPLPLKSHQLPPLDAFSKEEVESFFLRGPGVLLLSASECGRFLVAQPTPMELWEQFSQSLGLVSWRVVFEGEKLSRLELDGEDGACFPWRVHDVLNAAVIWLTAVSHLSILHGATATFAAAFLLSFSPEHPFYAALEPQASHNVVDVVAVDAEMIMLRASLPDQLGASYESLKKLQGAARNLDLGSSPLCPDESVQIPLASELRSRLDAWNVYASSIVYSVWGTEETFKEDGSVSCFINAIKVTSGQKISSGREQFIRATAAFLYMSSYAHALVGGDKMVDLRFRYGMRLKKKCCFFRERVRGYYRQWGLSHFTKPHEEDTMENWLCAGGPPFLIEAKRELALLTNSTKSSNAQEIISNSLTRVSACF